MNVYLKKLFFIKYLSQIVLIFSKKKAKTALIKKINNKNTPLLINKQLSTKPLLISIVSFSAYFVCYFKIFFFTK